MSKGNYKTLHLELLNSVQKEYEIAKRIYEATQDDNYLAKMACIDAILFDFQSKVVDKSGQISINWLNGGKNDQ